MYKIKTNLKNLQKYFNPEKATYKTIDKIIKNNYSATEIIKHLSTIKGVSKYPDELKEKFLIIMENLKRIEQEEKKLEEEKSKKIEKQLQEEKTKELKDLINLLEQNKNIKKEEKINVDEKLIPSDNEDKKINTLPDNVSDSKARKKTIILSVLIATTFLIILLLIFCY